MFSFVNFDSRKIWRKRQKNDRKPFNIRGEKAQQYSTHRHLGKVVYIFFEKMIKMQTVAYSCFLTPDTSWSNSLGMSEIWWGLSNLERVKWKQKSYNHIFKGFVSSDLWNKFIYEEIRRNHRSTFFLSLSAT